MAKPRIAGLTSALALAPVLAAAPGIAFADEGTAPATASDSDAEHDENGSVPAKEQWYGWLTLTVDFATIAAIYPVAIVGKHVNAPALPLLNFAAFELGAPVVHAVHGHSSRAVASALMRLALVGGPVYAALNPPACEGMFCDLGWVGLASLLGVLGAGISMGVDAALAYDRSPVAADPAAFRRAHLAPEVLSVSHGAGLGLSGAF